MAKRLKSPAEAARELREQGEQQEESAPTATGLVDVDDLEASMGDILVDDEAEEEVEDEPVAESGDDEPPAAVSDETEDGQESDADTEVEDPFLSRLSEIGFSDVESREQAEQRLIEAYVQQQEESRRQADEYEQRMRRLEAEMAARATQPAPQQQGGQQRQASALERLRPPQVDMDNVRKYMQPEVDSEGRATGGFTWKENTPQSVRQQAEAYQEHLAKWNDALLTKPHEVLPQIIQEVTAPLIQQYLQQYSGQMQTDNTIRTFAEEHGDWAFEKDPVSGKPKVRNGQYVYTPAGEQFLGDWENFHARGLSEQEAFQLAMERRELALLRAGGKKDEPPKQGNKKPSAAEKKREALERGRSGSGKEERPARRAGSFPGPGDGSSASQNPYQDLGSDLLAALREEGENLS